MLSTILHHSPSVLRYVMIILSIYSSVVVASFEQCVNYLIASRWPLSFSKKEQIIIFHLNFYSYFLFAVVRCSLFVARYFRTIFVYSKASFSVLVGCRLCGLRWAYHIHLDFIHIITISFRLHDLYTPSCILRLWLFSLLPY